MAISLPPLLKNGMCSHCRLYRDVSCCAFCYMYRDGTPCAHPISVNCKCQPPLLPNGRCARCHLYRSVPLGFPEPECGCNVQQFPFVPDDFWENLPFLEEIWTDESDEVVLFSYPQEQEPLRQTTELPPLLSNGRCSHCLLYRQVPCCGYEQGCTCALASLPAAHDDDCTMCSLSQSFSLLGIFRV